MGFSGHAASAGTAIARQAAAMMRYMVLLVLLDWIPAFAGMTALFALEPVSYTHLTLPTSDLV